MDDVEELVRDALHDASAYNWIGKTGGYTFFFVFDHIIILIYFSVCPCIQNSFTMFVIHKPQNYKLCIHVRYLPWHKSILFSKYILVHHCNILVYYDKQSWGNMVNIRVSDLIDIQYNVNVVYYCQPQRQEIPMSDMRAMFYEVRQFESTFKSKPRPCDSATSNWSTHSVSGHRRHTSS